MVWQVTSGGLVRYCCFLLALLRGSYKHTTDLFRKDCQLQDQYTVTETKSSRLRESCSASQVSEAVFSLRLQLFIRQIARVLFNVTGIRGSIFIDVSYLSVRSRESSSTSQVSEAVFSLRLQLFIRQIARVLFNVTGIRGSLFTEVTVIYPSDQIYYSKGM